MNENQYDQFMEVELIATSCGEYYPQDPSTALGIPAFTASFGRQEFD